MRISRMVLTASFLALCVNVMSVDAATIKEFRNGVNGYSGTQSTSIYKFSPDNAIDYADHMYMFVRNDSTYDYRGLMKFTDMFGSATNQIQAGSSIISATLHLTVQYSFGNTINIHLLKTSWSESITWNSFGDGGMAGTDWELPEISSRTIPYTVYGSLDFDVTSAVSAWSSGTDNNGLIFLATNDNTTKFVTEDNMASYYRPQLTVEYEENAVPEPLSIILLGLGLGISWFRKKFTNR